jgi:hypothetical protein
MGSRQIEHLNSQDKGLARRSSRAKTEMDGVPIHPGMASKTRGGPAYGLAGNPDASSASVTDPTRQCKTFSVPKIAHGMKSDDVERGTYDPTRADRIMGEATRSPDDYAQDLHTLQRPRQRSERQ